MRMASGTPRQDMLGFWRALDNCLYHGPPLRIELQLQVIASHASHIPENDIGSFSNPCSFSTLFLYMWMYTCAYISVGLTVGLAGPTLHMSFVPSIS